MSEIKKEHIKYGDILANVFGFMIIFIIFIGIILAFDLLVLMIFPATDTTSYDPNATGF